MSKPGEITTTDETRRERLRSYLASHARLPTTPEPSLVFCAECDERAEEHYYYCGTSAKCFECLYSALKDEPEASGE